MRHPIPPQRRRLLPQALQSQPGEPGRYEMLTGRLIAGGRALRFTLPTGSQGCDDSSIVVHELATGRRTVLVNGGIDARGALTRLTFTGAATSPVWTPDGRRICYMHTGEAFCQKADGSEKALSLFMFPGLESLDSLSSDGRWIACHSNESEPNEV